MFRLIMLSYFRNNPIKFTLSSINFGFYLESNNLLIINAKNLHFFNPIKLSISIWGKITFDKRSIVAITL